jgi:hypothetical protein
VVIALIEYALTSLLGRTNLTTEASTTITRNVLQEAFATGKLESASALTDMKARLAPEPRVLMTAAATELANTSMI